MLAGLHLSKHQALIEKFLSSYPSDPRAFDARLKLASILATKGNMYSVGRDVDEAMKILAALEATSSAPIEKRADAGFRRASITMQGAIGRGAEKRGPIVAAARDFATQYPADRRAPRLLVEAATVCDADPDIKRGLLEQARALSKEDALNRRIADDLARLDLLGKPLDIKFPTVQGGTFDSASERGNVVALVFWSAESPYCLMWLQSFRRVVDSLPKTQLRIATVSLDSDKKAFAQRMDDFRMGAWPTNFDGKGWANAVARPLGINALPTVFLLDKNGVLRDLNARDNTGAQIKKLLQE